MKTQQLQSNTLFLITWDQHYRTLRHSCNPDHF